MIEPQLWAALKKKAQEHFVIPNFAAEIFSQPWDFIEKAYSPNLETKPLDASYLAFLDEQIELGARGEEWSNVLRHRKTMLSPYVGRSLTTLSIPTSGGTVVIKFCSDDDSLVMFEALE